MSRKTKILIASFAFIFAFVGIGVGLYCAWPAINGTITNTRYYTSEDLQNAYDKGVEDTLKNKDELQSQVDYYRVLIEQNTITINGLKEQVEILENQNANLGSTNSNLNNTINSLQGQITSLNDTIFENETTITNLNNQVGQLNKQVEDLNVDKENNIETINSLNSNIESLQTQISNLNNINSQLQTTINSLNTTIENLNNESSTYEEQVVALNTQIANLQSSIAEYQKNIENYEQVIEDLKKINACVVTFTVDGELYNTQQVNKTQSPVQIDNPSSDGYIFDGWLIKGTNEIVDPFIYSVMEDIEFVASIRKYLVITFTVDGLEYDKQNVLLYNDLVLPSTPVKENHEFLGWSLDGENVIDISSIKVNSDTEFIAKFIKLHTVTFIYEEEIESTQSIRDGSYITPPVIQSTTYKVFNGWKVNGATVNLDAYQIVSDTTFIADIIYKYEVVFIADGIEIDRQVVEKESKTIIPDTPVKEGYVFEFWTLDGINEISLESYKIIENTTFIAKFLQSDFLEIYWNGFVPKSGQYVWTDGENVYYSKTDYYGEDHYILNKENKTWSSITWNGYSAFSGAKTWTDGNNIYLSNSGHQYVLDKSTKTWNKMEWNGLTNFDGAYVWTDGDNIYYSSGDKQYVLDKNTKTWNKMEWNGLASFNAINVWTDGNNIYLSATYGVDKGHYILDKNTKTWSSITWNGLTSFNAGNIWTDGTNVYYSFNGTNKVLNKSTNTWESKQWIGISFSLSPSFIWTDGTNIYCSSNDQQYILIQK